MIDHRIVLLGASNVSLSFRRITGMLRAGFDGRLDVYAAHGHGRSYGARNWIPGRALPGTLSSGVLEAANAGTRPRVGTHVLLTDVGNDLVYGVEPDVLLGWIHECLDWLSADDRTEIVITGLPIARMQRLRKSFYNLFVGTLFPTSDVAYETLRERALAVDDGLASLAGEYRAKRVVPPDEWYGLDPIHPVPSRRSEAWRTILGGWPSFRPRPPIPVIGRCWWLHHRPAERTFLGFVQRRRQPIVDRPGFRLSVY